jgi:hypothetical protein
MDLVCDLRGRVSRHGGAGRESPSQRQIEFTRGGSWGMLGIRENEENAPRFQRSGKTIGGVCVFGGGDVAVGAGLGFGFAGCGRGLLRWGDVPVAWTCAEEEFERFQPGEECLDGRVRASCAEGSEGLQHGVLPSQGSRSDRSDSFCAAERRRAFHSASHWSPGTRLGFFG